MGTSLARNSPPPRAAIGHWAYFYRWFLGGRCFRFSRYPCTPPRSGVAGSEARARVLFLYYRGTSLSRDRHPPKGHQRTQGMPYGRVLGGRCFLSRGTRLSTAAALDHPGGNPGAKLKSISHRCYLREEAFELEELTKETIYLPLGCLQGGAGPRPPTVE